AAFLGERDDRVPVNGLDSVHVDDRRVYAFLLQLLCRLEGLINRHTVGEDRYVGAVAVDVGFPDLEWGVLGGKHRSLLSCRPPVAPALVCGHGVRRLPGLFHVGRRYDDQVRQRARHGYVLERLVRCPVRAHSEAGVRGVYLDADIVVAYGDPYLVPVAPGREDAVGGYECGLAAGGYTGGDPGQVLLGHTDLDESFGKFLGEPVGPGRFGDIGRKHPDVLVLFAKLEDAFSEAVPARL